VYRTSASTTSFPAEYDGDYFFSDYYEGFIWRLHQSGGTWSLAPPVPGQVDARDWARGYPEVTQWTVGPDGSLYYARIAYDFTPGTGELRRIVYHNPLMGVPPPPHAGSVALAAPYPSPARGPVTLAYTLPQAAPVWLAIYDAFGRRVRELRTGALQDAGEHRLSWDGRDATGREAAPGVYLARLVAGDVVRDRRLVRFR